MLLLYTTDQQRNIQPTKGLKKKMKNSEVFLYIKLKNI